MKRTYMAGGTFFHGADDVNGYVLICGGYDCEVGQDDCAGLSDKCYTW